MMLIQHYLIILTLITDKDKCYADTDKGHKIAIQLACVVMFIYIGVN